MELSFRLAARTNGSHLATFDEFVDAMTRVAQQKYPGFDSLVGCSAAVHVPWAR